MFAIETLVLEMNDDLSLNKPLLPHQNLRSLNLNLKTINDLFILLSSVTYLDYNAVPLEEFVDKMPKFENVDFDLKEDFVGFFEQYLQGKVHRDFNALKTIHPGLLNWCKWLEKTGWKGEKATVQTSKGYMEKK